MEIPLDLRSVAIELGLLPEEYERISALLGREPNLTELHMFAVMWSEHCSYKNSIRLLKTLPQEGKYVLTMAGEENAGLLGLGESHFIAFKIESHNHPSAIEPYQGAATGVGGIHRDIFTTGARPIAALNSLRFGPPQDTRTQYLINGVIQGIADYGNAFGIPTVGGEIYFAPCYLRNPLVNAMSVGIGKKEHLVRAIAPPSGKAVILVGALTGRDGIHGASFASENLSEKSEEKLPAVQIGDPFTEKCLLEACLEAVEKGLVLGMQDLGAGGITCATAETAFKGKSGMIIHLDRVPLRQKGMQPFEILISESQERMLLIAEPDHIPQIETIFKKWDLAFAVIGETTEEELLRYYYNGTLVAEIKPRHLVVGGDTPQYVREATPPTFLEKIKNFNPAQIPDISEKEILRVLERLLTYPDIASKTKLIRQYDRMVGIANRTATTLASAAVMKLPIEAKALAMTVDGNGRHVFLNPYRGTILSVSEAARNIVCCGGEPIGVTNCLNFGDPYDPEVYWQFQEAVKGLGDACRFFNLPVTGGNVSFYNQSEQGPIYPTPIIGMIGLIHRHEHFTPSAFPGPDLLLYLLGPITNDIQGSSYLVAYRDVFYSDAPWTSLESEKQLQEMVLALIQRGWVQAANDLSDGGLLIALLESAFPATVGVHLTFTPPGRLDAFLFGESGARAIIAVSPKHQTETEKLLKNYAFPGILLGKTLAQPVLRIGSKDIASIVDLKHLYENALSFLCE
jgi:phosphoribosylformylglycinamidine synthase